MLRPDAVQRGKRAVQHVIDAVVVACLLDGRDVGRLLHHANQPLVAGGAAAVDAGIDVGDVVALRAQVQLGLDVADGAGQRLRVVVAGAQDVKSEALRALAAHAGQLFQLVYEARHGLSESRHKNSVNC